MTTSRDTHHCTFIPPWLAERAGASTLIDDALREARLRGPSQPRATIAPGGPAWTVHDAGSSTTLPGDPARSAGDPAVGDQSVDEVATGIEATLQMFADVLGRDSHDGAGAPVSLTVHYGRDYNNAFWDGQQLVFGDGDGQIFERFTKPIDVLAHEFGHAVVQHTCDLAYQGQSGALNESVADAFAACLKQRVLGQSASEGDWLIGEGIFTPSIQARALRDMAAPGTAYDDPELGADPQVGHMDDYIETTDDNGGVHLNSGIPNRAFQLAAVAIGGTSIEGAGRIWYAAITGGAVGATTNFAQFAAATIAAAGDHVEAVSQAWAQVGVTSSDASTPETTPAPARPSGTVKVVRTGGFAGITSSAQCDLDDPDMPDLRDLVSRAALTPDAASGDNPRPDMYVYEFTLGDQAPVRIPEHQMTSSQAELAQRVLRAGPQI